MLRLNENTAELVGVILGDGNIYSRKGNHELRITLNKKESNYAEKISNLLKWTIFQEPKITFPKNENSLRLRIQKKTSVMTFISLGLKSGSKTNSGSGVPEWIFLRKTFVKRCLRGLVDTDGSVYRLKPHWPNLWQLSFKNNNKSLLQDVRYMFEILEFHPSRIFGNRMVLTRQDEIVRYFKEIGTNNDKYSPVV